MHETFIAGSDSNIWNNNMSKEPFPTSAIISQLQISNNGKALIAGVGHENRPGSIIIFKVSEDNQRGVFKLDQMSEV
jgi:hypothetical protein